MTNFSFLYTKSTYTLFAPACIEAEQIFAASPALCAVGCWKALELAVEWVDALRCFVETNATPSFTSLRSVLCRLEYLGQAAIVKLGNGTSCTNG